MGRVFFLSLFFAFSLWAQPATKKIVILGTNDIHGGIEPSLDRDGQPAGGMALWSGAVNAIRQGVQEKFGKNDSGVLLVDAGDQFQGTLLSNYSEGQLLFSIFNRMKYDAVIPGNHDYDFGPKGWLDDKTATAGKEREVIEGLANQAKFRLLSANTFYKKSLQSVAQARMVGSVGCELTDARKEVNWDEVESPSFLSPYLIKEVAGVKVAFIGLDYPATGFNTTVENVSDLCFGDEAFHYLRVRKQLEGKADLFILIVHNGNTKDQAAGTNLVKAILQANPQGVHAVISGHTHFDYKEMVSGVPLIQSGFGGRKFGRVDFTLEPKAGGGFQVKEVNATNSIGVYEKKCERFASFCEVKGGKVFYEGVELVKDLAVQKEIDAARKDIEPLAGRVLGNAEKRVERDRISENPLSNEISDAIRAVVNADIAFVNTSGLREPIEAGPVTYEALFKVLPFNNHGLVVGPMPASQVLKLVSKSIQTCGAFGALMPSGLRVKYRRDCNSAEAKRLGLDPNATLVSVEGPRQEPLFVNGLGPTALVANQSYQVVTFDFLVAGGSGFDEFKGVPVQKDVGIVREMLSDAFHQTPHSFSGEVDGRWELSSEAGHQH